jgi:hypothetical protein
MSFFLGGRLEGVEAMLPTGNESAEAAGCETRGEFLDGE